jgi:hypothetical protein
MFKGYEIALGFLFASALWIVLIVLNSDPSAYHQICETNQYTDKASCPPHHIPYVIAWYVGNWFDKSSAVITAFATAAIAYLTLAIRDVNRSQLEHARRVERAHVSVLSPQSALLQTEKDGPIYGMRLWIVWKNSGTTPASPMNGLIGATWVESVEQFEFGQVSQLGMVQPFVLGPGAEIPSGTIDISPQHVHAIFNGQGALLLWGWARYRDIFPNSPEHVVEFCFRLMIEGQLGPPPFTGRVNFVFHGEHNRYYDT